MLNAIRPLVVTVVLGGLGVWACSSDSSNTKKDASMTGGGGSGGGSGGTTGGGGTAGQAGGSAGARGGAGGGGGGAGSVGTAGSGGGGGGSAGSGGAAGGAGGAGGARDAGASDASAAGDARAAAMPVATITPFSNGTITGKATFVAVANGVQVTIMLENCPMGAHPMHIHQGTSCATVADQGMHWDTVRGENIGPNGGEITCGADMKGMLVYTRMNTDAATRWTIGDGSRTDVIGHPVVVHGVMNTDLRHGCGVIK